MARKKLPLDRQTLTALIVQRFFMDKDSPSQVDIATEFGIQKSTVSRILTEAKQKKLYTVQLNLPRHEILEHRLNQLYGVDAIVVPIALPVVGQGEDMFTRLLAQSAAMQLEGPVSPIKTHSVGTETTKQIIGISCGATIRDLVYALTPDRFSHLRFFQLTVETETEENVDQSPFTLVSILYGKWRRESSILAVHPLPGTLLDQDDQFTEAYRPIREEMAQLAHKMNVSLVGIGDCNPQGNGSFARVLNSPVIDKSALKQLRPVGEIVNRPFNRKGEDLFEKIPNLAKYVDGVEINTLKSRVHAGAKVIAIAGGQRKVQAIEVALKTRMVSTLITDMYTAQNLCELMEL